MIEKKKATRTEIWAAIRKLRKFTRADLTVCIAKDPKLLVKDYAVKSYLRGLHLSGHLSVMQAQRNNGKGEYTYTLENDVGSFPPDIKKDGSEALLGRKQKNLWRSMKILRVFNHRELALTSSNETITITDGHARAYVKDLHKAGYLRCQRVGNRNGLSMYMLIKNTGPLPPVIKACGSVYDKNLNKIVWNPKDVINAN